MDPHVLVDLCLRLHFPLRDLALALQLHLGPRRLQRSGLLAPVLLPLRSILAGCAYSIPFTRAYLREAMEDVCADPPDCVPSYSTVYVDDVGQIAVGSLLQVEKSLSAAACRFVKLTVTLKLTISSKAFVVASSPVLASRLQRHLAARGVQLHTPPVGRDLGFGFSSFRRRRTLLQQQRLAGASARLKATRRFATVKACPPPRPYRCSSQSPVGC